KLVRDSASFVRELSSLFRFRFPRARQILLLPVTGKRRRDVSWPHFATRRASCDHPRQAAAAFPVSRFHCVSGWSGNRKPEPATGAGGGGGRAGPERVPILSLYGPPVLQGELRRIRVPENRASGSSRQIELAFVRLPTVSRRPGPPIVWLSGGPGVSGIADL